MNGADLAAVAESHREHGSYVKYVQDQCRCAPCRAANRRYKAERSRRVEPPYVDAEPARQHIRFLAAAGVGLKRVAKSSGVAHGTLSKLVYGMPGRGPSKRIRPATEAAILAVQPNAAADGAKVDAAPTWRLIDAMVAAGVPKVRIAAAIGQRSALQLSRSLIQARHARTVARLHADWIAGRIELTRTHSRWHTVTIAPPDLQKRRRATERMPQHRARLAGLEPIDDVSELFDALADAVELRNSQPWRRDAACRGRPVWMWFPAPSDDETAARARKVCLSCVVRHQCRGELFDEPDGIVAGIIPAERRRIREEA